MHLLGETALGIAIILLLGTLVVVKRISTDSVLDKPQSSFFIQSVNIFNLFFLMVICWTQALFSQAGGNLRKLRRSNSGSGQEV